MANFKGTAGRRPRSRESRIAMHALVPESAFTGIQQVVDELGISRSDFAVYAAVKAANEVRALEGREPIAMPDYIAESMRQATVHRVPLQEALLAS